MKMGQRAAGARGGAAGWQLAVPMMGAWWCHTDVREDEQEARQLECRMCGLAQGQRRSDDGGTHPEAEP